MMPQAVDVFIFHDVSRHAAIDFPPPIRPEEVRVIAPTVPYLNRLRAHRLRNVFQLTPLPHSFEQDLRARQVDGGKWIVFPGVWPELTALENPFQVRELLADVDSGLWVQT